MNLQLVLTLSARFLSVQDAHALAVTLRADVDTFMRLYFLASVPGLRRCDVRFMSRKLIPAQLFYRMYYRDSFGRRVLSSPFLTPSQRELSHVGVTRGCPNGLALLDRYFEVITGPTYCAPRPDWSRRAAYTIGRYVVHPDLTITTNGLRVAVPWRGRILVATHHGYREVIDIVRLVLPFVGSPDPIHDVRGPSKVRRRRAAGDVRRHVRQSNVRMRRGTGHGRKRHRHASLRYQAVPAL